MTDGGALPTGRMAVFSGGRAPTTLGILLVITSVAFEGMGVGTAMPDVMADVGSLETYAWPFVSFLASSVLATVLGGRWADARGPAGPLVAGVTAFAAGLVVAGTASTLELLLVGRVLQGLGAGALTVAIFVLVALVYPASLRPAVFGWTATAWVLPSLLGPPAAAYITETWSWHWVFLAIAPIAVLALVMMATALRRAGSERPVREEQAPGNGGRWLLIAAPGAAVGVAALSWAGERPGLAVLPVVIIALVVLVPSVLQLVPRGTLIASRGVATAVLARGLLAGSFFAMNAFLPLMLTDLYDWTLRAAGGVLIAGSLGWSAASTWQGGRPHVPRQLLLRIGFGLLAVSVVIVALVTVGLLPPVVTVLAQVVGGLGMGLGMPAVSLLVMGHSAHGEVGFNTAAAQILDNLTTALLIAVGGALSAVLALQGGYTTLLAGLVAVAVVGALLAPRSALPAPATDPA
ncbi:MFS transporter [Pseudactinotalea sp.]|uniref:MFS transporter n=1 Tax=Pseudactinotalea sp. TaxID=1926260 RepID=UPI003B3ACA67